MAAKSKKETKSTKSTKKDKKSSIAKKVNTSMVNASIAAINTTVENAEKWQKLGSKLIKKSEKVREQQINMVFDTAEAVKGQVLSGADKMKDLVGFDAEIVEKAKDMAMNNPVSRKVAGIVEDINEKVSENPMIQKAEKATEDMKMMGMAKFNELKGDVIGKASEIVNKAESKLEEAKEELKKQANKGTKNAPKTASTKTAAPVKTKTSAKKAPVKATAAAKKTVSKAKTAAKEVTPVKATKVATKKVSESETEVKAEVRKTVQTSVKDDLKLIYGIGPKTEIAFNNNGINTYAAFAKLEASDLESILKKESVIFSSADVKDWKKQAEVGAKDGAEALIKWVERYRSA